MILGTDMAHHVRSVFELELAINKAKDEHVECILITPKKHVTTLGYILHACDLSNPTKPFPIYNEWTGRVMEEFFAQSSDEKARGMDITLPEEKTAHIAAFQIGFLRFIRPFFEALNNIKDISMKEQLLHLNSNLQHWLEDRKKRGSGVEEGVVEEKTTSSTPDAPNTAPNTTTSLPHTTPGIQIVQARYGTTSKDVDVTDLIQAMVVQGDDWVCYLSIDKTFNFNKAFTDPAKFRRKYLRLIALVDGKPYTNNIYEMRKTDFFLQSGVKSV